VTAVQEAIRFGSHESLEKVLVGSRIWVDTPDQVTLAGTRLPAHVGGPFRVTGFRSFHPADPPGPEQRRKKHLVQLWTDFGLRTLAVGSICFRDPKRQRS
jgi:hypothetical protein